MKKPKTTKTKEKKQPYFRDDMNNKIESFISKQKGDWFFCSDLKKTIHNGRTDIGGGRFLKKLILVFNLERKKENGKTLLRAK
jgi:hypothetical protein